MILHYNIINWSDNEMEPFIGLNLYSENYWGYIYEEEFFFNN